MSKVDELLAVWAGAPQVSVEEAVRQELVEGGVKAILDDIKLLICVTQDKEILEILSATTRSEIEARVREIAAQMFKE